MRMVKALRGAIRVDSDNKDEIIRRVTELVDKLTEANMLREKKIISIQFTQTADLRSANPATALRTIQGYDRIPLFCAQEPAYEGGMERVIRILLMYYEKKQRIPVPVYLNGAENLRGDLFKNDNA